MADDRAVTKGEVLAMKLAAAAGIHVAEARLIHSDGIPVALIRRFDRTPKGGRRVKSHPGAVAIANPEEPQSVRCKWWRKFAVPQ